MPTAGQLTQYGKHNDTRGKYKTKNDSRKQQINRSRTTHVQTRGVDVAIGDLVNEQQKVCHKHNGRSFGKPAEKNTKHNNQNMGECNLCVSACLCECICSPGFRMLKRKTYYTRRT